MNKQINKNAHAHNNNNNILDYQYFGLPIFRIQIKIKKLNGSKPDSIRTPNIFLSILEI